MNSNLIRPLKGTALVIAIMFSLVLTNTASAEHTEAVSIEAPTSLALGS